jgi:hypothetical protein
MRRDVRGEELMRDDELRKAGAKIRLECSATNLEVMCSIEGKSCRRIQKIDRVIE